VIANDRIDLHDPHAPEDGRLAYASALELFTEAGEAFGCELPGGVVAEAGHDVVDPRELVEVARRFREVRDGVQPPVDLDEFAQGDVVGDRCLSELAAALEMGGELLGVAFSVKRAAAFAAGFSPAQLPAAVGLLAQVHQLPPSIAVRRAKLPGSVSFARARWRGFGSGLWEVSGSWRLGVCSQRSYSAIAIR